MNKNLPEKNSWCLILKMIFFLSFSLKEIHTCPFTSYEESLLPVDLAQQNYQINYPSDYYSLKPFKMGYWSFFIPQLFNNQLNMVEKNIGTPQNEGSSQILSTENGQSIIYFESDLGFLIIGFLWFDPTLQQIGHKFIVENNELFFQFPPLKYEGIWIFTLITFENNQIVIEMTGNEKQQTPLIKSEKNIFIQLGGGAMTIQNYFTNKVYQLNQFTGRMSKIIFIQEEELLRQPFTSLSTYCTVPPAVQGEQIFYLINGFYQLEGNGVLTSQVQHFGNRFFVSFWIKYDFSQLIGAQQQGIFFIQSKNSEESTYIIQIFISTTTPSKEIIALFVIFPTHQYPTLEKAAFNFFNFLPTVKQLVTYDTLSKWHFLKIEYGVEDAPKNSLFDLIVFDGFNSINKVIHGNVLTNSIFYFTIGGLEYYKISLYASFYNFKFQYNYNYNKPRDYLDCHYSCLACNGPYFNNCTSCDSNSNRVFLIENQECQCLNRYIDVGTRQCENAFDYFQSIIITEQIFSSNNLNNCEFGKFKLPVNSSYFDCLECPQQSSENIQCLDCLINSETWYQQPVCTKDFKTGNINAEIPYTYYIRNETEYDVYFISFDKQLTLNSGLMAFCQNIYEEGCFQSQRIHLYDYPFVLCKPNHKLVQKECVLVNYLCQKIDFNGKCTETISGWEYHNDQYFQCPLWCKICEYDIYQNKVQCTICEDSKILSDGQCLQCGLFCKFCQNYYDEVLLISYLKCFKCIDDSKYYISFDGINCKENVIRFCNYAFQAIKNDWTKNTLDLYFTPRNDLENIVTHCGRCSNSLYIINNQTCLWAYSADNLYNYAQELCNIQITKELKQKISTNIANGMYDDEISFGFDDNYYNLYCTTRQYVLFKNEIGYLQFSDGCEVYSQHCKICLLGRTTGTYYCLLCQNGYYAEKVSDMCQKCPPELNCKTCVQQHKLFQDGWKTEIRMFYKQFVEEQSSEHLYSKYGQTQFIEDYEVVCNSCQQEYDLFEKNCIKKCPSSCSQCKVVDGENVCIKCKENANKRSMTILGNECVECSENCAVCVYRDQQSPNSLFSNSQFFGNSLICLKSFENQNLYFDNEIKMYVSCQKHESCQKELKIKLQLICSRQDYISQASMFTDPKELIKFQQENIYIDDLLSAQGFKQFENNYFYLMANSQQIKYIDILITSEIEQICLLSGPGKIEQQFSANIYSAIHVKISLIFPKNTQFLISEDLVFSNFDAVYLQGLTFKLVQNQNAKSIVFESVFKSSILLNDITYISENQQQNPSNMIFKNIQKLQILNFAATQIVIENQDYLLGIFNAMDSQATIIIKNFTLSQSKLVKSNVIAINLNQYDIISIEQLQISSYFEFSSFLVFFGELNSGNISLSQVNLSLEILNSPQFLNFSLCQFVRLNEMHLQFSSIINSTLIILNNFVELEGIFFNNNSFQIDSIGFQNTQLYSNQNLSYNILNFLILDNQYHQRAQFMQIKKFLNDIMQINISNFQMRMNYIVNVSNNFNQKNLSASLIYFQVDFLNINFMLVERGYGLPEILILNANSLNLSSIQIFQAEKFRFFGMHSSLDCQLKYIKTNYYGGSIIILASKNIFLKDFQILEISTFNSPIILIKSETLYLTKRKEQIVIQNFKIENNLVLLSQTKTQICIIFVESLQEINIIIENSLFLNNVMQQYIQDQRFQSALILYLDCYVGILNIQNTIFQGNIVFNSTDSLNFIHANSISINNCSFLSNNIFNFNTLKPHLLLTQQDQEQYYLQDIQNNFPIYSTTGNGLILAQIVHLSNSEIRNSQGSNGAGFRFILHKESQIQVINVEFFGLKNIFKKFQETGGCLSIDARSSQSLQILIENIIVEKIHSRYQGGFVFFVTGEMEISIVLRQIYMKNVFSQQGSIIYAKLTNLATLLQQIIIQNIKIECSIIGMIEYYDEYFQVEINQIEELRLLNNMTLFYLENSNELILKNIHVDTLINTAFLDGINNVQTKILQVVVQEIQLKNPMLTIAQNFNSENVIVMNDFQVKNQNIHNSNSQLFSNLNCTNFDNVQNQYQKLICPDKSDLNPTNFSIKENNLNLNYTFGRCYFKTIEIQDYLPESLISINPLYNLTFLKISNFKISNIICSKCQKGLIFFNYLESIINPSHFTDIFIINSDCGIFGCLNLLKSSSNQGRILNSNIQEIHYELFIQNYQCLNNTSYYGVCLYINNIAIQVNNSQFYNNKAQFQGGSIYVKFYQQLTLIKSLIQNNSAEVGGGIYFGNSNSINYQKLESIISSNNASYFSNDIYSLPQYLTISYGNTSNYFGTYRYFENESLIIDQILGSVPQTNNSNLQEQYNYILMPSGQQLNQYMVFNQQQNKFISFNKKLRIVAYNYQMELVKNLTNSFCNIKSRLYNISEVSNEAIFQDNLTNMQLVYFNQETQDYNLDNLSMFFNSTLPNDVVFQIEFNCSCIRFPILRETFPYDILGFHHNYKLRVNVRSFPCQYGEIYNASDHSCQLCNSNLGFFSIKLNQSKCQLKDDISTASVTPAQLNLRQYFWRPYFDSSQVDYCLNNPENCLGGWHFGDVTCYTGHIGALCEQCDCLNLRGDGEYTVSEKYSCQLCSNNQSNIIILIFVSLWTLISIFISVQDSLKIQNFFSNTKSLNMVKVKHQIGQDDANSSTVLKIFINYFQIISSIIYQLQIPMGLFFPIHTLGTPIKTIAYSLDCFLQKYQSVDIQYLRVIWQLWAPIFYINSTFLLFFILSKFGFVHYNIGVMSTSIIYIFLYLQPSIIGSLAELLSYREISGFKWIQANVSQLFETIKHQDWIKNFILPIFILLAIIIPLFLFYKIVKNKNRLFMKNILQHFGFLYIEYKQQCFFWEIINIFKKEFLIIILTFYDQDVILKFMISIFILLIYIQLNLKFEPYRQNTFNLQDYRSTGACICSMVLVSGIYQGKENVKYEIIIIYAILLTILNLVQIFQLLLLIIHLILKENIDEILDQISQLITRYPILQNIFCFQKLMTIKKQRIIMKQRFQMLKLYLNCQVSQIKKLKEHQQKQLLEFNPDNYFSIGSSQGSGRESAKYKIDYLSEDKNAQHHLQINSSFYAEQLEKSQ